MVGRAPAIAFVLAALCLPGPCGAQSVLEQIEREVAAVVKQARAGVVAIEDERIVLGKEAAIGDIPAGKKDIEQKGLKGFPQADQQRQPVDAPAAQPKSGTGFCVAEGYVVTTADVLEGMMNPLVVTDSGARYRARVVKIDPELNIGLLRLPEKSGVPELPLGESASVLPGHFAITIGNQSGHINAVGLATIASIRAEGTFTGARFYPRLMQIAGTVGAGSSGSPLLNTRGEIIGMLAAAPAPTPVESGPREKTGSAAEIPPRLVRQPVTSAGFAIPIDDLKPVIREMRTAKFYARAWVGLDLREVGRVEPDAMTVRVVRTLHVEGVYPESPAAKAGLKKGDVIVRMNGREIGTLGDFRTVLVGLRYNTPLKVEVLRGKTPFTMTVPFEMRPPVGKGGGPASEL
jgi:serine protease Do